MDCRTGSGAITRWSFKIFRAFGIDVRVHLTFLFIVAYFAFVWGATREPGGLRGALYGVLLVILLFGLVVIHELTHSRVAQAYGIRVSSITLLPIGGMAVMDEMPQDPRKELAISIAGPLSNVAIAAVMLIAAPLFVDLGVFRDWGRLSDSLLATTFQGAYLYLMIINVSLAVFNLLPAFPMDGGRVFRSFLALRLGRPRATRIAVAVGQGLAILMGLAGILGGGIILILVAIFIFFGAQAEGTGEAVRGILSGLRVTDALNNRIDVAWPAQEIGELATRLFHSYQEDFPVLGADGTVVGVITRDRLIASLAEHGPSYPVTKAMRTDFPLVQPNDLLYEAFLRMREGRVKAVPVLDDGRLVGMLSLEDISEVYSLLAAAGPELARRIPVEADRYISYPPGDRESVRRQPKV